MIHSIPNPPMDKEDISRFRSNLRKHLTGDFSDEEIRQMKKERTRENNISKQIIANCGGKNPILGY